MSTADSSSSVRCPTRGVVLLFLFLKEKGRKYFDKCSSAIPALSPSPDPILLIVPTKMGWPRQEVNLLKRICVTMADAVGQHTMSYKGPCM